MMRTGGLPLGEVFDRVRLRVNEMTKGGEVPWNASKVEAPFFFFERAPDAPPPAVSSDQVSSIRVDDTRVLPGKRFAASRHDGANPSCHGIVRVRG
jgi:uncharacterized caspase-like protein